MPFIDAFPGDKPPYFSYDFPYGFPPGFPSLFWSHGLVSNENFGNAHLHKISGLVYLHMYIYIYVLHTYYMYMYICNVWYGMVWHGMVWYVCILPNDGIWQCPINLMQLHHRFPYYSRSRLCGKAWKAGKEDVWDPCSFQKYLGGWSQLTFRGWNHQAQSSKMPSCSKPKE